MTIHAPIIIAIRVDLVKRISSRYCLSSYMSHILLRFMRMINNHSMFGLEAESCGQIIFYFNGSYELVDFSSVTTTVTIYDKRLELIYDNAWIFKCHKIIRFSCNFVT